MKRTKSTRQRKSERKSQPCSTAQTGLAVKSLWRMLRAPECLSSWPAASRTSLQKMAGSGQAGDCAGTPSGPLPPTAVREQRMGMSENALLPSLVRPQASGPGSGGERLSPWATFQSQTAFPFLPPCRTSSALEDQGPVSTVGSQKPHHSPRRTLSWLMETCQT